MPVVGLAEVLVTPSFKNIQKEIGDELTPAAGKVGKKAGGFMSNALSTAAGIGIAKVGFVLGKGVSAAFTKGFSRLQALENARAKLTGLGHDAQTVTLIMQNAGAAVKGTAFGLGEAGTVAANAVAAGVKPGKELERTLKLVADSATIAGTDMGTMGAIFNKAAASNKVQMDIINQLHDAGVPALQLIANQLGVTAEEASKMASAGEVDFATFQAAMEKGMGGAALESGKTLQGAFDNSMASLGRFGANLMEGLYPQVREFFQGFISFMGPMEEKAKVVGTAVGKFISNVGSAIQGVFEILVKGDFSGVLQKAFGIEEDHPLVGFLFEVRDALTATKDALIVTGDWVQRNRAWLEPLTVAVVAGAVAWKLYNLAVGGYKSIAGAVIEFTKKAAAAQWGLNAALSLSPIGIIITLVAALVAAFIYLWHTNEGFRNFFITAWDKIKGVVQSVGNFIGGVFSAISSWVTDTLGPVFSWLHDSVIKPVWDSIAGIFTGAKSTIESTVGAAFVWLRDTIVLPVWNAIQTATTIAAGIISTTLKAITNALAVVGGFLRAVFGPVFTWLYESIIKPVWGLIKWQIDLVSNILLFLFDLTVWTVKNVLAPAFTWLYANVIKPVWSGIQLAVKIAWAVLKVVFGAVVGFVRNSLGAIFSWLYERVIKPVWLGIQLAVRIAWAVLKVVFGAVVGFVRNSLGAIFTWLYEKIIKPVWSGIQWFIGRWWAGVKIIFNAVRGFIRDTLAPIFSWLYEKIIKPVWDRIKSTIKGVWDNGIKPVFKALGSFVTDSVVPAFKKGVDAVGKAWEGIKKAAGTPVHFVLDTIYNKGIKATFDKVAGAIGSKARLPEAKTGGIPHFAKGGLHKGGWALVGEEGPELVNFSQPGRVYTAEQTRGMLSGKEQAPAGAFDGLHAAGMLKPEHAGIGGFWSDTWSNLKGAASAVGNTLKKGIEWVRGGLAKAAEVVLTPLKEALTGKLGTSGFGGLWSGVAGGAIDKVVKWIRGKDEEAAADGGPVFYDGALGSFAKPANGRVTSGFGTSRGRYPHAGIDFAVPIGSAVRAMLNGVVRKIGVNAVPGRTGKGMVVDHAKGYSSYYGHLSGWIAKPGQEVKAGQLIAKSGNTGRSTGPHLHAELWKNGKPFNYASYLYDDGGVLPPGLRTIMNRTSKPEAILNPAQWAAVMKSIDVSHQVAQRGNAGFPDSVVLVVEDGVELRSYLEGVTDNRMRSAKREARRGNRQLTGQR